ncbi:trypsin-like peptidase domain-containing protein [Vibrio sp. RE86]|uniref:S1 family peptidase n=1 Tax=Vibrio sp. RE86 TaxID=2607605 RepID=UPI001493BBBB|nr:serine protease [Vibrio sp. RE86]NOH82102.1 trypsin-like peptidase domain-containing protein [Vibrio sp. RE86]
MLERKEALVGRAQTGTFGFADAGGNQVDTPERAIFPILKKSHFGSDGKVEFLGSGFFIAYDGWFITAKHVLTDVLDEKGNLIAPITVFQIMGDGSYHYRPIQKVWLHEESDICVGKCKTGVKPESAPMDQNFMMHEGTAILRNAVVSISDNVMEVGSKICTYAYPTSIIQDNTVSLNTGFYEGEVVEYFPQGRGDYTDIAPCYQTSMHLRGGASGGPVFDMSTGKAFAVNSSSFGSFTDVSFVHTISAALDITIGYVVDDVVHIDQEPEHSLPCTLRMFLHQQLVP